MPIEIHLRQLHACSEDLQAYDEAGGFLRYVVFHAPFLRGEKVEAFGAEDDADEGCEWGFGEVEAVADEGAEEGVDQEEGRDD